MSKRDRGLLEAAGLSIPKTTVLFGRSRAALYQGLSNESDYFSARDAMVVLHDAKRRDSPRMESLIAFIQANYPSAESDLILLDRIAYEQFVHAVEGADELVVTFNGNLDHLQPMATFRKVLGDLFASRASILRVFVVGDWAKDYIRQHYHNLVDSELLARITVEKDVGYLPSFAVIAKRGSFRAFFFGRLSIEELPAMDAEQLWKHFEPKYPESAERNSRAAG